MQTRGRAQKAQSVEPKRAVREPKKKQAVQKKQEVSEVRKRRSGAVKEDAEPQVVKKVKVSAALTKEGLLSLMSEKANKNGNIPIKEFRAFLKELNNEKAEEFFETLQAEELVENRKTMVHLYSEAERKELGEKKQRDLVEDELSECDERLVMKQVESQNVLNALFKDHTTRRVTFSLALSSDQYRSVLLKRPQLKDLVFRWDHGHFQQEMGVFQTALQELQAEKPQFGQKEGKVIRLTFDFTNSISRWARGSGRRRPRYLRQTFSDQDLVKVSFATSVFTRLRVLRVKIPNVNLATLTEPLIQWFTQLPKRLVRLTELEFSMNTIADILLVCLESFEMSESECKEREHPVEKWTVSFTDSKKIERVMVDAVGESGDKGERVFQYRINLSAELLPGQINNDNSDINKLELLGKKSMQISELSLEQRVNLLTPQLFERYSSFVSHFNYWSEKCKQMKKLKLKIFSNVRKLNENFPLIQKMAGLEEVSIQQHFFQNQLNEDFLTDGKRKELATFTINELLAKNMNNIEELLPKSLQVYDFLLQAQNGTELFFSFQIQLNLRAKSFFLQFNQVCPQYLKHLKKILDEVFSKTQVQSLKLQFNFFVNAEIIQELLEILIPVLSLSRKITTLDLSMTFQEQLNKQHHKKFIDLLIAVNDSVEHFIWSMKETQSQNYQAYVMEWLDHVVKLDKVSSVTLNFGVKTWSKQKDVKSIVQIAANAKCALQLDLFSSTFHGIIFDNPLLVQERCKDSTSQFIIQRTNSSLIPSTTVGSLRITGRNSRLMMASSVSLTNFANKKDSSPKQSMTLYHHIINDCFKRENTIIGNSSTFFPNTILKFA